MKRTILFMTLGLLVMNLTSGCNKTDESSSTSPTMPTTNEVSTNAAMTNAPAH